MFVSIADLISSSSLVNAAWPQSLFCGDKNKTTALPERSPREAVTFLCLQVQKQGIKGTRAGMGLTSHRAQD